jgi:hypothetical protein
MTLRRHACRKDYWARARRREQARFGSEVERIGAAAGQSEISRKFDDAAIRFGLNPPKQFGRIRPLK